MGYGKAHKEQVQHMVQRLLKAGPDPRAGRRRRAGLRDLPCQQRHRRRRPARPRPSACRSTAHQHLIRKPQPTASTHGQEARCSTLPGVDDDHPASECATRPHIRRVQLRLPGSAQQRRENALPAASIERRGFDPHEAPWRRGGDPFVGGGAIGLRIMQHHHPQEPRRRCQRAEFEQAAGIFAGKARRSINTTCDCPTSASSAACQVASVQ